MKTDAIENAREVLSSDTNDAEHDALVELMGALGQDPDQTRNECGEKVWSLIGCSDGVEVCRASFDGGEH